MKRIAVVSVALLVLGACVAVAGGEKEATPIEDLLYLRDPAELQAFLADPDEPYFLVDVRTPEEYASGHIPKAIQIDYLQIASRPPTEDKDAFIILYCRSGNRSSTATVALVQEGYTRVLDWGGVINWPYDLVTGSEPE